MRRLIRINFKSVFLYFFSTLIMFLAGMSMGGYLAFVFYFMLLYPVISVIHLAISGMQLRYFENLSQEHPQKGEKIDYIFTMSNESVLPGVNMYVKFKLVNYGIDKNIEDLYLSLDAGKSVTNNFTIKCPYRGIYNVGIESLELTDSLKFIRIYPEVFYKTFYVYPRIIQLDSFLREIRKDSDISMQETGRVYDYTLFDSVKEYRTGDPVKHIAWKKFFQTGNPYIKTYDSSSTSGVIIYMDTRRAENLAMESMLEQEDCSVEILVSLVRYFLSKSVQTNVCASGLIDFSFRGNDMSSFESFYKSTIKIDFNSPYGPKKSFLEAYSENSINCETIIFITHVCDPEIFSLVRDSEKTGLETIIIVNQMHMKAEEKLKIKTYMNNLKSKADNIVVVNNSQNIKEDLQ